MVKQTQTVCQNCWNVFDHFAGLTPKGLKFPSYILLKNMPKILILNLKKRGHFFQILLFVESAARFDVLIFCNILHLEMNFGNLY